LPPERRAVYDLLMKTPRIATDRLTLEPFAPNMVSERYVSWLNDPDVVRYSEQRHRRHTHETCLAFVQGIDHERAHMWAISNGRHIGNITAHRDVPNRTADVGILLGERDEWGKGYGYEAWTAVCNWLLASGARMVTAGTMEANRAMVRIFQRSGMTIEAIRPGYFLLDGEPTGMVLASAALRRGQMSP
jgi:ribosomal-protein-alanine N-acetyltransferase